MRSEHSSKNHRPLATARSHVKRGTTARLGCAWPMSMHVVIYVVIPVQQLKVDDS